MGFFDIFRRRADAVDGPDATLKDQFEALRTFIQAGFDGLNFQNDRTAGSVKVLADRFICPTIGAIQPDSTGRLTRFICQSEGLGQFCVFDVGASGGLQPIWDELGARLKAVGFDPIIEEVARLNAVHHLGDRRFVAGLVSGPEKVSTPTLGQSVTMWNETSASKALDDQNLRMDEVFNSYSKPTYSDHRFTLDEFMDDQEFGSVNFIKIDTDGVDFDVLRGASRILDAPDTIGLMVEAQFHGGTSDKDNTFANIDVYLRQKGFNLYKLTSYNYSNYRLPSLFLHSFPSQTRFGQIMWGDAVYLRNPSADMTASLLLKLAILFDLFELPDCAAKIFVEHRDVLSGVIDCDAALDIIARQASASHDYKSYMKFYDDNRSAFYENK